MKRTWIILSLIFLSLFFIQRSKAEIYTSISGKVIGEDTGQGVPDVSVLALKIGGGKDGRYDATTDNKGVFILKDVTPGMYMVGFYKEDSPYLFGSPHLKVVVPKGKNVVNVNHVLTLGGSVSGTVYDADGVTPMSRVRVSAEVPNFRPKWVNAMRSKLTDSNGKFLLQGLPESNNCIVEIEVPGHAIIAKTVKITKGTVTENANFVVKWDDVTGISGYVKSAIDNEPIKNAEIVLGNTAGEDIGNAYTDETGRYSIVGVAPGMYEATAFWPKGGGWIDKMNILVEQGKSTIVNFDFDKSSPN